MDKAFNPNGQKSLKKFLKLFLTAAGLQGLLLILGFCLIMGNGILMLGCDVLMIYFHYSSIYHLSYLHHMFFKGSLCGFAMVLLAFLILIIWPPELKP